MKATGVIRKIDNLGRLVLPIELRRTLRLRLNEPIEIFTKADGELVLKKFSPVKELGRFAQEYTDSLYQSLGHMACIADRDSIIAASGADQKQLLNKQLAPEIEKLMEERKAAVVTQPMHIANDDESYNSVAFAPIISEGDIIGCIILAAKGDAEMGQLQLKMSETAAGFLAKQLEN